MAMAILKGQRKWLMCVLACTLQHLGFSVAFSTYPASYEQEECVKGLVCLNTFYQHGKLVVLPWMVVFTGVPIAAASLAVVHSGFRMARAWHVTTTPPRKAALLGGLFANCVMCTLSMAITGLSLYLALQGITIMLVFMLSGFVACFALTGVNVYLLMVKHDAEENANLELIESATEAAHAPLVTSDTPNSSVTQSPVVATYGVVPGTSEYALKYVVNMDDADYSKPLRTSDQTRHGLAKNK